MVREDDIVEVAILFLNLFKVFQFVIAGIMCVFGYKWSKGLIASASSYIGIGIGGGLAFFLLQNGSGLEVFLIPIALGAILSFLAYRNVIWNHFLVGALLSIKVLLMFFIKISTNMSTDASGALFALAFVISIVVGILVCSSYNQYIILAFIAYTGAVEVTTSIFDFINNGLFLFTGNLSFIFNPIESMLALFGISIPSVGEILVILVLGLISFWYQRNKIISSGIDFSNEIVDDRKM